MGVVIELLYFQHHPALSEMGVDQGSRGLRVSSRSSSVKMDCLWSGATYLASRGGDTAPLMGGSPSLLATFLTSPPIWSGEWTLSGIVVPLLLSALTPGLDMPPCSRDLWGTLSGTFCKPVSTTPISTLDHHTV